MPERKPPPRRNHPKLAQALGVVGHAMQALEGRRRVLVGVSGGPDSVALLGLIHRLRAREELVLGVTHVDHGLRAESAAEGDLVASICAELKVEFESVRLELEEGPGLPARAREARHAALSQSMGRRGYEAVALGHTATDQVETVLMHLTRGSGLDGLSGMPAFDGLCWRPLLDLRRQQTRETCGLLGLDFVDDPTNENRESFRVELRKELLPRLRAHNPQLEASVVGMARQMRDADEALDYVVAAQMQVRKVGAPDGQILDLAGYAELPRGLRTRLVLRLVRGGTSSPLDGGRRIVEDVDRALCADARAGRGFAPRTWALPGGSELWVARGQLGVRAVSKPEK
jgi:tRNA(Ile)-lysidine synthase